MGIAIPQVVTSDRATGAQVIDGSLLFEVHSKSQYLKRTPGLLVIEKLLLFLVGLKGVLRVPVLRSVHNCSKITTIPNYRWT